MYVNPVQRFVYTAAEPNVGNVYLNVLAFYSALWGQISGQGLHGTARVSNHKYGNGQPIKTTSQQPSSPPE